MDQRVARLWIKALRSGDYKQTQGCLRSGDSYCCLGVLCDIYAKETGKGKWESGMGLDRIVFKTDAESCTGMPPMEIKYWTGSTTGTMLDRFMFSHVSSLNDFHGQNFNDIADYVESTLGPAVKPVS